MAVSTTIAERVREALAAQGLTLAGLAQEWGIDRSALSTRLNSGKIGDDELQRIADRAKRPIWWLRYGVEGSFTDGVRWALYQMRSNLDAIAWEAREYAGRLPVITEADERRYAASALERAPARPKLRPATPAERADALDLADAAADAQGTPRLGEDEPTDGAPSTPPAGAGRRRRAGGGSR